MGYLRASDTINGQEGKATATIDGEIVELFYLKDLEATMDKNKTDVKALGKRGTQKKPSGWDGSGSMTLYYITSKFRELCIQYAKTGVDFYFTLTVTNEDPSSTVGKQTTVLYNCNIDSVVIAKLDVESETLEESIDFTFDDVDILDSFGEPTT